jgi:outer membrane protein OmpA-like peptidoglycan-associated protein
MNLLAGDATQQISGKILQVGIGARPVGMGEAQVAVSDDAYSLYWNPAGLSRLTQTQISLMHNAWFGEINSEYIGYAQTMQQGGYGIGINYINFGEFKKFGIDSNNYPVPLEGSFTPYTLVTTFGCAQWFWPQVSLGGNVKLVSESVDTYNNITAAVDLGAQMLKVWNNFDVGLMVQNLGLPIQGYNLPLVVKLGTAYSFFPSTDKNRLTAVLDLNVPVPIDLPYYINAGLEYWFANTVAVRAGYKVSEINSLGTLSGLTAGMGVKILDYTLDYAYADYGVLGITHRISFTAGFGETKKARTGKRRIAKRIAPTGGGASAGGVLIPRLSGLTRRAPITVKVQGELNALERNKLQRAVFEVQTNTESEVAKWELKIFDAQAHLLRKYTGSELQESVIWDGKDQNGRQPAESIFATYEYNYTLASGTSDKVAGKLVEEPKEGAGSAAQTAQTSGRVKMEPVLFEEKSYDLSEDSKKLLTKIADTIKSHPYLQILIEGYADMGAEKGQEVFLSQRRADTAVRFLTTTFKVPLSRISSHARGNKSPVASNQTDDGRAKNRRVEITIVYSR